MPGGFFPIRGIGTALADDRRNAEDSLDRRLKDARAGQRHGISAAEGRAESRGWAIGIEFVGTVLVSAFVGWLLDGWLGTGPWLMIVLLLLGFAAGTRRAMKTSAQFDATPDNDNKD